MNRRFYAFDSNWFLLFSENTLGFVFRHRWWSMPMAWVATVDPIHWICTTSQHLPLQPGGIRRTPFGRKVNTPTGVFNGRSDIVSWPQQPATINNFHYCLNRLVDSGSGNCKCIATDRPMGCRTIEEDSARRMNDMTETLILHKPSAHCQIMLLHNSHAIHATTTSSSHSPQSVLIEMNVILNLILRE